MQEQIVYFINKRNSFQKAFTKFFSKIFFYLIFAEKEINSINDTGKNFIWSSQNNLNFISPNIYKTFCGHFDGKQ